MDYLNQELVQFACGICVEANHQIYVLGWGYIFKKLHDSGSTLCRAIRHGGCGFNTFCTSSSTLTGAASRARGCYTTLSDCSGFRGDVTHQFTLCFSEETPFMVCCRQEVQLNLQELCNFRERERKKKQLEISEQQREKKVQWNQVFVWFLFCHISRCLWNAARWLPAVCTWIFFKADASKLKEDI